MKTRFPVSVNRVVIGLVSLILFSVQFLAAAQSSGPDDNIALINRYYQVYGQNNL